MTFVGMDYNRVLGNLLRSISAGVFPVTYICSQVAKNLVIFVFMLSVVEALLKCLFERLYRILSQTTEGAKGVCGHSPLKVNMLQSIKQ